MMKSVLYITIFILLTGVSIDKILAMDYTLGVGDLLQINVYEHEDLKTQARIDGMGYISLPLIGKVQILNLTISEASKRIEKRLSGDYIINPQVSINILSYESKKAVILGQVKKPGLFEIRENMTLLELISQAGGLSDGAGDTAIIKRKTNFLDINENTVIYIDLKKLIEQGDTSLNIPIAEGDSVYINKTYSFFVTGEVKKPGEYKYEEKMTIIKAITLAGGLTGKASSQRIKIIRKIDGKEEVFDKVLMDQHILPDDVIVVPESFF